jgi:hypothetical protein
MAMRLAIGVALALMSAHATSAQTEEGLSQYLARYRTLATADEAMLADLSRYYHLHAVVQLGREQRLDNGVAWRLLTDARTGAAVPRLTWMADRKSLLKANALFDALHGEALVGHGIDDLERRRQELYGWHNGRPPDVTKPPYAIWEHVAVTYATSRLVSYVEVKRRLGASVPIDVRGRVLDLERGQVAEIEGCRNLDDWRDFRFGDWLEVCGDAAYERFEALWSDKLRQAVTEARARGANLPEEAADVPQYFKSYQDRMAFYLTPAGLAVVDKTWQGLRTFNGVSLNPVILPYRELEPFLKPGPWRDELLKTAGSTVKR